MTKQIELVNKHKFIKTSLNNNFKTLVMYIIVLNTYMPTNQSYQFIFFR